MTTDTQIKTEKLLIDSLVEESVRAGKIDTKTKIEGIFKLTGDASSRRYFRVDSTTGSYVVCLQQTKDSEKDTFLEMQSILESSNIRVPRVFDHDLSKGYILEEDLGDRTLLKHLSGLKNQKEEILAYEKALGELIKIHAIDKSDFSSAPFSSLFFDEEKLFSETMFTVKHLITGLFNQKLTVGQEKVFQGSFKGICKTLASQKMVPCHRDYHSRNIMMVDEDVIVIDFQDARMGIPQYDLASLLEDCYYKISRQNKHDLKIQYWENFLKKKGIQESKEEFLELYDLMTIQRVFKALGSFAYIYALRGDVRYLKYIGYAFEKLRDVLFRYDELRDLRVCLSEIYYEY
ncbi:MAG: phosphotransferase [Halobacteriovoraceae bacterium]|nr:phosphotransferase [Halobacteriovoraceae bacterium]